MKVLVSNSDKVVISEMESISDKDLTFETFARMKYSSNEKFWNSEANEIKYRGTHIARHQVNILEDISLQTIDAPKMVSLFFVENGTIESESGNGSRWKIGELQHNLIYNSYNTAETFFKKQTDLRLTIVSFAPSYFVELCDGGGKIFDKVTSNVAGGKSFVLGTVPNLRLSVQMLKLINSFSRTPFNNAVDRLLTESCVLELFALQIGQLYKEFDVITDRKLSSIDVKKLYDVRDLILSDLTGIHTLNSLSRKVGLNVYKLKYGFKLLFGQPVFKFLNSAKLEYAASQLDSETKSISQIAYESGFSTLSHFSDAFKKQYGVSPNKFR